MSSTQSRQNWLEDYWSKHKRATIILPLKEYRRQEKRIALTDSKTVGQHLYAQSNAYEDQRLIIPQDVQYELTAISRYLKNQATNLNQLVRYNHSKGRMVTDIKVLIQMLQQQDKAIDDYINKSWRSARPPKF